MSPDDCKPPPLTTDNLFDEEEEDDNDDDDNKQFVSICKQKHEHLQHLMRNMEESHDAEGNRHNTGICCDPKIAEFRVCCEHFF